MKFICPVFMPAGLQFFGGILESRLTKIVHPGLGENETSIVQRVTVSA